MLAEQSIRLTLAVSPLLALTDDESMQELHRLRLSVIWAIDGVKTSILLAARALCVGLGKKSLSGIEAWRR